MTYLLAIGYLGYIGISILSASVTSSPHAADRTHEAISCVKRAEADCNVARVTACSGSAWQRDHQEVSYGRCTLSIAGPLDSQQLCWDASEQLIKLFIREGREGSFNGNGKLTVQTGCAFESNLTPDQIL